MGVQLWRKRSAPTALGISRDDAATFLPDYVSLGILLADPFVSINFEGAGELVHIAVEREAVRGNLKMGICGEHAGDSASVRFATKLDWTTSSVQRIGCRSTGSLRHSRR